MFIIFALIALISFASVQSCEPRPPHQFDQKCVVFHDLANNMTLETFVPDLPFCEDVKMVLKFQNNNSYRLNFDFEFVGKLSTLKELKSLFEISQNQTCQNETKKIDSIRNIACACMFVSIVLMLNAGVSCLCIFFSLFISMSVQIFISMLVQMLEWLV
jgi:hypothetical protein